MDRAWTASRPGGAFSQSAFAGGLPQRPANPFAGAGRLTQNTAQRLSRGSGNPFERGASAFSRATPFQQTGKASRIGYGGSPVGTWNDRAIENMEAQYGLDGGFGSFGSYGGGGMAAPTGPSFAGGHLDDATHEINAAAAKWGVPANLVKAILAKESTGNWGEYGGYAIPSRGERILPYSGIFESTAKSWGYDFNAMIGNRGLQIDAVASGLSRLYGQYGSQYGWEGVASVYFSGRPVPSGWVDELGNSDTQYVQQVIGWWKMLDEQSGGSGGAASGTGTWQAWQGNYTITQEHGPTAFSQGAGAWMYGYASSVGVQGHPGLDVGMPAGTSVVTPVAGTVVIAGGSGYYRDVTGDGPGRGELRLQLDNGDIIILGHMRNINVQVGQRVTAGMTVGSSGSFNGDHLHYEIRKYTPGATSSGYTAVDPRQYFSGNSWSASGMSPTGGSSSRGSGGAWWMNSLQTLFGG